MRLLDYAPVNMLAIFGDRLSPVCREFMKWSGGKFSMIDRTGTLDLGLQLMPVTPIPELAPVGTFAQCMDERAVEIIATGRPLNMYWSGGIDSTSALVALMKAGVTPEQLTVNYTFASLFEYERFFKDHIDGRFPTRKLNGTVMTDVTTDKLIVTGEMGDQVFGSVKTLSMYQASPSEARATAWKDAVPDFSDEAMAQLEQLVAIAPWKIEDAYDFLWWISFTCKWQHVYFRMGNKLAAPYESYVNALTHFFCTDTFQRWSMDPANRYEKCDVTWESYKLKAKEYIYDFTGDEVYLATKRKVGSLPTHSTGHFLMRVEGGELVSFGQNSDSKLAYGKLYGDRFDGIFKGE